MIFFQVWCRVSGHICPGVLGVSGDGSDGMLALMGWVAVVTCGDRAPKSMGKNWVPPKNTNCQFFFPQPLEKLVMNFFPDEIQCFGLPLR